MADEAKKQDGAKGVEPYMSAQRARNLANKEAAKKQAAQIQKKLDEQTKRELEEAKAAKEASGS